MASSGFEPANLGTKGQHATPRPPKLLFTLYSSIIVVFAKYETDYLLKLAVNYKKTNITIMN